ncbi:MAG: HisA/HisF-related TIM barrel protein [Candidatus Thorarchaeota archaeon]
MIIIPVLDLLNGIVVHGIGGKRDSYQPIHGSLITNSSEPIEVIHDYKDKLNLDFFYIADLDMIQNHDERNFPLLREINKRGFQVMVDYGCRTINDINIALSIGNHKIILGTETIDSMETLRKTISLYGGDRIILSIDVKDGQLLANSDLMKQFSPLEIANYAENLGIRTIIVLDLHKVGSQKGPLNDVLLSIAKNSNSSEILAGGGVRNKEDLIQLKKHNISGALIATAFHKGKITKEDLESLP